MADVDLYGGDAERIRNQYRQSLGRDASNDEVSGWLSGSYGGGNTDSWLQQIQNSGEAQAYRPPTLGPSEGENGKLNPGGWAGYDPNRDAQIGTGVDPALQSMQQVGQWYQQYLGRQGSTDELSKWLSGAYGWGSASNLSGIQQGIMGSAEAKARPQYQNTDWWGAQGVNPSEMFNPTTGQPNPGWQRTANGYERTQGGSTVAPPNGNYEAWFTSLTNGKAPTPENLEAMAPILAQYGIKLGSKGNRGWTDTIILPDGRTFDVIEAAGIGTGKRWVFSQNGGPGYVAQSPQSPGSQYSDPHTKFLEQLLQQIVQARMTPVNDPNRQMYEMMLKQRGDALATAEPQLQRLTSYLEERFKDLQGNGYTGAEGEAIRTGALDPIEQDRQAARKRVMERLSARGLTPDSGIAQQALLEVDKAFDAMRGTTQTALTTNDLNRREDRKQRAQTIGAQLVDIPQARAREQLDVFAALNQLSQLARQEDEARQREAAGYSGVLSDLGPQRLQLAMQAAGMGGNPSSMFGNLMQLAGLNQNAAAYGAQNQSALWSGLGSIAAMLANSGR